MGQTIVTRIRTRRAEAPPPIEPTPVEPVKPEPVIPYEPVQEGLNPERFALNTYKADEGNIERIPTWMTIIALLAIVVVAGALVGLINRDSVNNSVAVYTTDIEVTAMPTETGKSCVRISTPRMADPVVDVYRNNTKVECDIVSVDAHNQEVALEAGDYVICAIRPNQNAVTYANYSLHIETGSADISGITPAVRNYIAGLVVNNKTKIVKDLYEIFKKYSKLPVSDVSATEANIAAEVRKVLGFDEERASTEEYLWQRLLGPEGIIDNYITSNNIDLTPTSYPRILAAIAEGLK